MATLQQIRNDLINGLPNRVRDALVAGDDAELADALGKLTEEEQQTVRDALRELAALPQRIPSQSVEDGHPDPPDSPDMELQKVEGFPSAPDLLFRVVDGVEVRPPQEWFDATHRAEEGQSAGSVLFPVWFATTRKFKQSRFPRNGFAGEREEDGQVHYGVARVFIPAAHELGSLGSFWLKRWLWTWQDDRLMVRRIEGRDPVEFWNELRQQLAALAEPWEGGPAPGNQVLLFVHGYNVSFNDAVLRSAQLGYDLAIPGITACFSWPSRGTYRGYPDDEAACEPSVPALAAFIRGLADLAGPGNVHILAHSMGNRVVLRAIEQLAWESRSSQAQASTRPLGHVVLAAPDIDRDLFRLLAPKCPEARSRNTNVYVSRNDRAVSLSRWLHGYPRAGFHPPVTVVRNAATVDVTHVDISGHSSFCQDRRVLRDISQVLNHDALPEDARRQLLRGGGGTYWELG